MDRFDITLVNMPFAMPLIAPLGVGVLCGALRRAGCRVRCRFANVDLAERVPEELYDYPASNGLNVDVMLADWLFAEPLFGPDPERDRRFLEILQDECGHDRVVWNGRYRSSGDLLRDVPLLKREAARCVEKTAAALADGSTRIVGCSSTFFQRLASLALLKRVRELNPEVVTFLGGSDCEGEAGMEAVRSFPFVDYVFCGEGDLTVPEMTRRVVRNERSAELPFGVFDRAKAERGVPEVACVPGDAIAEPDSSDYYERIKGSRLHRAAVRKYFLESSRGCWKGQKQHCSFCGLNGERVAYRRKDPGQVLAELRRGYREFGCRIFLTADTVLDLNTMRDTLRTFGEEAPDAVISYETVSTLTEEQVRFLADCGVMVIQSGIETLHPKHIRLLNKGNGTLSSIALLKFALENRIQVLWNMLSGIPGDSPEEYRWVMELIPKLAHLPGPNWGAIRFDKFSLYWKEPERFGLKLVPMKGYRVLMPEDSVRLERWALFYDNLNPAARTGQQEIAEVRKAVDAWYRDSHPAKHHLEFTAPDRLRDTRPGALAAEYRLSPDEQAVLRAARSPADRAAVEALSGNPVRAIEKMKEHGYLIEVENRLLALPLIPPGAERIEKSRMRYRSLFRGQTLPAATVWEEGAFIQVGR
ncbi:RiPP maturation radical SAM C-methyltransferase [bacterium]|nr:RiPP maturation radical SAM C-methyltransferase [bacterium]